MAPIQLVGIGSVDVVLENVVPVLSVAPIQSPKGVTKLPYMFTLAGTSSEGNGPPYGVSSVQVQVGNGPFQQADGVAPGFFPNWSFPVVVQNLGDTVITVRASDAFGGVTTVQQTLRLLEYTPPPPIDPNAKKTTDLNLPTTSSITSWTRLEPQVANADMGASTSARVFDPLWFMTRQWQIGEFQGEDAGSPVRARVRATNAALTRAVFGELPPSTAPVQPVAQPYDPTRAPLETLVERRPMRPSSDTDSRMLALAVEAGLHFLRMVELNTRAKKYRAAFLSRYLLEQPPTQPAPVADDATRRFIDTMVGRAPDARRLAMAFRHPAASPLTFDPALKIAAADLAAVQQVATSWLAWYDGLFAEPATAADDAWVPPRLEYAVSVATRLSAQPQDGVTLSASEFDGGRLDWSSFDINTTRLVDTTGDTPFTALNETTIPSPVTFGGAPAPRFWEMEDAKTAYGLVPVGPTDLVHLMLIEYASTYGNDWYAIPLTTPVGTITRVDSLVVTDTFGVRSLVRPIGDPALSTPHFSMWQQSSRRYPGSTLGAANALGPIGAPVSNRFFLPPTLARSVDGNVLEDVLLLRDEMANLAWGVERNIEGAAEAPVSLAAAAAEREALVAAANAGGPLPRYQLSSSVPENWIPLLPVQIQVAPNGPLLSRLKRGAVLQPDGSNTVHSAHSETLNSLGTALLFDEEVPREGTHITRRRRMARWIDGSTWVWTAFRNEVGSGEGSAGLQFDDLLPPDGTPVLLPLTPPPPPGVTSAILTQTTLAVGGPASTYSASLQNQGPSLSGVALQGWINEGTARRDAGQTPVDCGGGAGVLPTGVFTVTGPIAASNTGGGTGTLAPGAATFELQLTQGTTVVATFTVPLTLVSSAPTMTAPTPSSTSATIDGASVTYSTILNNPGLSQSNVLLQGWIDQAATRRAAGGAMVMCGAGVGVLPTGTFTVQESMVASNATGGNGTLVAGPATLEVQLIQNSVVLDTKTVPITLVASAPPPPPPPAGLAISALTSNQSTVLFTAAGTYSATLTNPGASMSNVVLQGWINQGSARRAAGGSMVVIGSTVGILPNGTSTTTGSIVASNGTSGNGTLVAGPATFELQLLQSGTLLFTKIINVMLA